MNQIAYIFPLPFLKCVREYSCTIHLRKKLGIEADKCTQRRILKMNYLLHPRRTYSQWVERQEEKCEVSIDNPRMRIKGKPYPNITNDPNFPTFIAFFGVPYARPPVRGKRFQPPKPLKETIGKTPLLRAYKQKHSSLQESRVTDGYVGKEDCLYLNIYLPKKPGPMPRNLPVLVYIHGGGFEHGTGDIAEVRPDAIVKQNVVFVTINYRLNIFGFLNMGTKDCRGNAGLKDQVMALKWIRANIDRFDGDPHNVTIMGHSAGGTCVNLHMVSPLSKGLFRRAIVMAGGIHCPWGYQGEQHRPRKLFCRAYGMPNELRHMLVRTLKEEDARDLMELTYAFVEKEVELNSKRLIVFCGPSLEIDLPGAFISRPIAELMDRASPIPLLAGIVELEGYMFISLKWHDHPKGFDSLVKFDEEFISFLMQNFGWNRDTAERNMGELRSQYFPKLEHMDSWQIQNQLAQFCTDIWFRRFYDNFKIGHGHAPFYAYKFCYHSATDRFRQMSPTSYFHLKAPTHGDELLYLFDPEHVQEQAKYQPFIQRDMKHIMEHMCSMWTSFCKSGVPRSNVETTRWLPHTEENPCYLEINSESTMIRSSLNQSRWERLSAIVNREPVLRSPVSPDYSFDFLPRSMW